EEVTVHPREIARDVGLGDGRLDAVDGGGVALAGQARPGFAVYLREVMEAIVESAREMRGRASRLASADGAVVEDDDGASLLREKVRGGEAGDARPRDADVRSEVRGQRRAAGNFRGAGPDRETLSAFRFHVSIVEAGSRAPRQGRG